MFSPPCRLLLAFGYLSLRVQYLPEVVESSKNPFPLFLILNRLHDPDQTAGIVLLKPVNTNDVVFHDLYPCQTLLYHEGGYR